jgi:hypothetical protein
LVVDDPRILWTTTASRRALRDPVEESRRVALVTGTVVLATIGLRIQ